MRIYACVFLCSVTGGVIAVGFSDAVIVLRAAFSVALALIIRLAHAGAPWVNALIDLALVSGGGVVIAAVVTLAPAVPSAVSVASAVPAEDASVLSKDFTVQLVNGAAFVIGSGCDIIIIRVDIVVLTVVFALAPSEFRAVSIATAFSAGFALGGAKGIEGLVNFALVWLGVRVRVVFVILLLFFTA